MNSMIDAPFRIRELHALFIQEIERKANDRAIQLLKQIIVEARSAGITDDLDAPSVSAVARADYWRRLYEQLRDTHQLDRAMDVLEYWRKDEQGAA